MRTNLDCASCHTPGPDGEHFEPVTMARTCATGGCHQLTFDTRAPELPHGKSCEAMLVIEDFFARVVSGDPSLRPKPGELALRLPDREQPEDAVKPCPTSGYACAQQRAQEEIERQFGPKGSGCVTCHVVRETPSTDIYNRYRVMPVRLTHDYLPATRFSHKDHLLQRDLTGEKACSVVATPKHSRDSDTSAEVLIPDIGKCQECHSDRPRVDQVAVQCVSCHTYHPMATTEAGRVERRTMKISPGLCSLTAASLLGACSGGGSAVSSVGTSSPPAGVECTGNCANAGTYLTAADVEQIIAQGVAEASARHVDATIAVVDRVGNVLAVYRMGTANARSVVIGSEFDGAGAAVLHSGLEGLMLPVPPALAGVNLDQEAAIAKAITGAYLSSEGNAFSTRTASQIIQEHFNPGVQDQPSGPLFGVQFSQLACSDFILRNPKGAGAIQGPQRSPLGLAADPGGFPLYKAGTVVGGVGVLSDAGIYSLDKNITDIVVGSDEAVAYAATYGYAAPADRRADQITVNGLTLRFSDVQEGDLSSDPSAASPSSLPSSGAFLAVPGYGDGKVHAGVAFGQPQSGIRADGGQFFPASLDAYLFVDPQNLNRYPPKAGTDGYLTQPQVQQLLISALEVASETRAQIRIPAGQSASVTIAAVDTNGAILGMVRTQDAPVFGADVSLQKARSAVFLSSPDAGPFLSALPPAQYIATLPAGLTPNTQIPLSQYVAGAEGFLGNPQVLDGTIAWSDRGHRRSIQTVLPGWYRRRTEWTPQQARGSVEHLFHGASARPVDQRDSAARHLCRHQ